MAGWVAAEVGEQGASEDGEGEGSGGAGEAGLAGKAVNVCSLQLC